MHICFWHLFLSCLFHYLFLQFHYSISFPAWLVQVFLQPNRFWEHPVYCTCLSCILCAMMWSSVLTICCQLTVALAAPASNPSSWVTESRSSALLQRVHRAEVPNVLRAVAANMNQPPAAVSSGTASQGMANTGENAAGDANENAENNVNGAFNQNIQLGGNNVKTDVLFTKSVSFSVFLYFEKGFSWYRIIII